MNKLKTIYDTLDDMQLTDIIIFDMREHSPFFDYVVIASARNTRQLDGAVRDVKDTLKDNDYPLPALEGDNQGWTLLDGGDIIINLFTKEEREHYNIEKMWLDVPKIEANTL